MICAPALAQFGRASGCSLLRWVFSSRNRMVGCSNHPGGISKPSIRARIFKPQNAKNMLVILMAVKQITFDKWGEAPFNPLGERTWQFQQEGWTATAKVREDGRASVIHELSLSEYKKAYLVRESVFQGEKLSEVNLSLKLEEKAFPIIRMDMDKENKEARAVQAPITDVVRRNIGIPWEGGKVRMSFEVEKKFSRIQHVGWGEVGELTSISINEVRLTEDGMPIVLLNREKGGNMAKISVMSEELNFERLRGKIPEIEELQRNLQIRSEMTRRPIEP